MEPLVSCICVTTQELERPVHCFWQQNMPEDSLELLVVHPVESPHPVEGFDRTYLERISAEDPRVRGVRVSEIEAGPDRYRAGIEAARGKYFALWDPQHYHGDKRLQSQLDFLEQKRLDGCALNEVMIYDPVKTAAYIAPNRTWLHTLVHLREAFPGFENLQDVSTGLQGHFKCIYTTGEEDQHLIKSFQPLGDWVALEHQKCLAEHATRFKR